MKSILLLATALLATTPALAQTSKVAEASNQLAFDLYRLNSPTPGNLFFSPLSIETALAMTSAGAQKETLDQMNKVLHLSPGSHAEFKAMMTDLKGNEHYQLSIANRLWSSKGQAYDPTFLKILKDHYMAEPVALDFKNQPEPSRVQINQWVEKETQQKIKDLLPPASITSQTELVLTNAVYFKGTWAEPFKKSQTSDGSFTLSNGAKKKVPLMNQLEQFKYAKTEELQFLEMPYKGDQLAMDVLLPKVGTHLSSFEKKMTAKFFADLIAKANLQRVDVSLPKFKTEFKIELANQFKSLGMVLPFDPAKADFHGIRKLLPGETLAISKVIHQAFVDVNEEGTEAAAATAVGMVAAMAPLSPEAPPEIFKADRPFLFFIRHLKSGAILFMGRYSQP